MTSERTGEQKAKALLADLLDWHRREAKPAWWRYFYVRTLSAAELIGEPDALGGLTGGDVVGAGEAVGRAPVLLPAAGAPVQRGDTAVDPASGKGWSVWAVDDEHGTIDLKIGQAYAGPLPAALVEDSPVNTKVLAERLRDLGDRVVREGVTGQDAGDRAAAAPAADDGGGPGGPLRSDGETAADAAVRLVLALRDSYLPIQGPPGTGKTFTAAGQILELIKAGRTVGITGPSHAVIHNLIGEVIAARRRAGGRRRASASAPARTTRTCIRSGRPGAWRAGARAARRRPRHRGRHGLAVGPRAVPGQRRTRCSSTRPASCRWPTSWPSPARPAISSCWATRSSSPSPARPPTRPGRACPRWSTSSATTRPCRRRGPAPGPDLADASAAVPVHLRGVLRREADLRRRAGAAGDPRVTRRSAGSGLRVVEVAHEGNTNASPEEAAEVARLVRGLVGREWHDKDGARRAIGADEVLVVTPYNAQIRAIEDALAQAGCPAGSGSGRWTSSRAARRRWRSTRWPPRRPTMRREGWSSSTTRTG